MAELAQNDAPPSNVVPITNLPLDPRRLPNLYAALAKAQLAVQNPEKNAENPGFMRGQVAAKYADLAAVLNAIREPFAANGLALFHTTKVDPAFGWVDVTATLVHASGEYLDDTIRIPVLQKTPQSIGSSVSYGRRYTACAMGGVAQEDDDGMGGPMVPNAKAPPKPGKSGAKPESPATEPNNGGEMTDFDKICIALRECQNVQQIDELATKNINFAQDNPSQREVLRKLFADRRRALEPKK